MCGWKKYTEYIFLRVRLQENHFFFLYRLCHNRNKKVTTTLHHNIGSTILYFQTYALNILWS